MRDEKGKITVKSVWQWLRSDTGKKYSFFIFYFFFFLVLIIFLNMPKEMISSNEEENNVLSLPFKSIKIENENYNFKLTIKNNLEELNYKVQKENKEFFLTNDNDNDKFNLLLEDGKLKSSDDKSFVINPDLINIFELKRIIKAGTLKSEVKFPSSNEYEYNYEIPSSKLGEILEEEIESLNINKIVIHTTKDKDIKTIEIDITDFMNQMEINKLSKDNEGKIDTNIQNNKEEKEVETKTEELKYTSFLVKIDYGEIYE